MPLGEAYFGVAFMHDVSYSNGMGEVVFKSGSVERKELIAGEEMQELGG